MGLGRSLLPPLALLATASAMVACTSAATLESIRTAEVSASVRTFAPEAWTDPRPDAALGDVAFEQPLDRLALTAAVLGRQPSLVAAAHRVRARAERARAVGKLPPPEVMADLWQVPFTAPYALDKAGMIMLSVRQTFPAAGALDKMAEAMALEAHAEAAKATAEARALVREVDRAFADYAEASARHAAHSTHQIIVEHMEAAARARYQTGGPLGDVTRADLERARTEAELEKERGMVDETRAKLNGLLARPTEAQLGPPRPDEATTTTLTAEQASARAASHNPEVQMAEHMERSARAAAGAADREASVPMISAGFSTFLPTSTMPVSYGVSFSMSLPWVWGAAASRAKSAEQQALAEHATAQGARLRMRTDAAMALAAVRAAERRYRLLRDTATPAAHRALDATRAGYAARGADILMWIDAARMALDVALDLATARGDLDRALANLDFAVGEPVPRAPLHASLPPVTEPHHATDSIPAGAEPRPR